MRYEENKIQESFVLHVVCQYPDLIFTCAPAAAKNVRQGMRNKRMGYCKGWPDLFFPLPNRNFHGLFIEFKSVGEKEKVHQKELRMRLEKLGYKCFVCWSVEEAIIVLEVYLKIN